MENNPTTQAPAEDETQALKSSTNVLPKRPLVKSTPSKTSSLTRATAASATRTTTTSGLSKPPTRPPTISSVRRAPAVSTVASGHQKRASIASTDAATSGDEKKKTSGLSAKPKRMSLAPTTSTSATRATAATAASRRSTIQPSPTSERKPFVRQSVASPTKARTTPSTPSSRVTPGTTARTRPLTASTSSLRSTGVSDGKKRLSTIPASPAVKSERHEDRENHLNSLPETTEKPARPALGGRQSTRSVALAQRIREFEIVNQMLQVAMAQEGDDEGQEQAQNEAAITIAKLKTDLAQAVDKEAVEAQVEDVEIPEPSVEMKEPPQKHDGMVPDDEEIALLREQLAESQGVVNTLTANLEELKDKVAIFSASAEEESRKVQGATEAIRKEHAEKVDSLINAHKREIDMLHAEKEEIVKQKTTSHSEEIAALQSELTEAQAVVAGHDENASTIESLRGAHAEELEKLRKQLEESENMASSREHDVAALKSELADAMTGLDGHSETATELESVKDAHAKEMQSLHHQKQAAETKTATHIQDLTALRTELEEVKTALASHQERSELDIKPEDHKAALRELEEDKAKAMDNAKQSHLTDMKELQAQLDDATQASIDVNVQQKTEITRLGQVVENFQKDIGARDEAQKEDIKTRVADITREHEKAMAAALEEANSSSSGEVERLRKTLAAEYQMTINELRKELDSSREEASRSTEDAQAGFDEQIRTLESKMRSLQGELEATKMQTAAFKHILSSSEKENQEKDEEHAETVSKLEADVATSVKRATEQQMKVMDLSMRLDQEAAKRTALEKAHAKAIQDMEAEHEAAKQHYEKTRGDEIKSLKAQHADTIKDGRAKEEALTRQIDELLVKHDSVTKQLDAQSEAHNQTVKELQLKHDNAFNEMQTNATAHEAELELLKSEHANAGASSEALAVSHKQALETLQEKHDQIVRGLEDKLSEHAVQLTQLSTQNADHSDVMKKLELSHAEHVKVIKAAQDDNMRELQSNVDEKDAELAKLNTEYAETMQKLEISSRRNSEFEKLTIQNTNMATELKSVEASHSAYLEELRKGYVQEIKAAESVAKTHFSELEQLKAHQQDSIKDIETNKNSHTRAINDLKSQHADQLTKLHAASKDQTAELNKLKMQRGLVTEETKAREAAHNQEIKEIQARHAATMEAMADAQVAEIERMKKQHADALQKAATSAEAVDDVRAVSSKSAEAMKEMQIKIASLEAKLALATKTTTNDSTEVLESAVSPSKASRSKSPQKKKSSKSINGSGSPGLAHSKWAQAAPSTPLKQEYGAMRGGSATSETVEEDTTAELADETEISSTAPTPASAPRKHNIEGQLAGIQEQLKHLDHVDAEMLEQHERMAKTLSRIDTVKGSIEE